MKPSRDTLIYINLVLLAILAGIGVIIVAWNVFQVIVSVLILLLVAMLVAFLLGGVVGWLQGRGLPRGLAVVLIYLALIGILFGFSDLILVPLAGQLVALAKHLPGDVKQLRHVVTAVDAYFRAHSINIKLETFEQQALGNAQHIGKQILSNTLTIVLGASQVVVDILAVLVISLYLLIDGPRLRHNILRILPEGGRNQALFGEAILRTVIGSYIRGQLLLALIIGLMAAGGTFLLGVEYPLVIGLVAGFFELVPMLGPIAGALPAIGIAWFQSGWQFALAVVVLFIIIQQLEAHVIAPRVMGHAVGVHPIVAILAVLLGIELDGIVGAFIAVPVAGIIYVIAQAVYAQVTGNQHVVTMVRRPPFYVRYFQRFRPRHPAEGVVNEPLTMTIEAPTEQLAEITRERDLLAKEFARAEEDVADAETENGRSAETSAEEARQETGS
ncbi:MAG: AI-2E family transporter [Chloroflexota bacterium]